MIEEMAQCKNAFGFICNDCKFINACERYSLAEELYNAGYRKIDENAVVLTKDEIIDIEYKQYRLGFEYARKKTAEKFAVFRKYITEQFHHYHEIRDKMESDYKKEKEEVGKSVLNNDWHRADAIMFILEKVGIEFDEIAKEITEGNYGQ